ncbi:hypothetical protein FHW69_003189 [Luteibacter sp. Sphag1AF]|uniref:hypothetical protein n=1 Tax=Luteibacter sp. Sphag1AF TaxID=2587031 RepID=UPI00160C8E76|nr:hypothetical protein [Luteibacter sp. Sphag1AF]MBB3228547.1 hypothetical protein [Luteibacter sp. Sphag1AF]
MTDKPSTKSVLHVRPSHFTSGVATGLHITGPTDDGFVHLHFFREVQRITNDDVPARIPAPNELELDWSRAQASIHLHREELAVISVPAERLESMCRSLTSAAQFLAKLRELA